MCWLLNSKLIIIRLITNIVIYCSSFYPNTLLLWPLKLFNKYLIYTVNKFILDSNITLILIFLSIKHSLPGLTMSILFIILDSAIFCLDLVIVFNSTCILICKFHEYPFTIFSLKDINHFLGVFIANSFVTITFVM
jgi:hypothetical protein